MTDAVRPGWSRRLTSLRQYCAQHDLGALVVSNPVSLRYLTGFDGSAGLLLCTQADAWLITDGRYTAVVKARVLAGDMAAVEIASVDLRYDLTLGELAGRLALRRVGFEAAHVTVSTLDSWRKAAPIDWVSTEQAIERMRVIKDAQEVETLRRAGRLLSGVARGLGEVVRAGRSELSIARDIDAAIERAGFSKPAFETIVAAGPNSAHPHAHPGGRRLEVGDLAVLDFGGVLDGYCVDLTRMAGVGRVREDALRLVTAVRDAHGAAMAAVRPGVFGADVDRAARQVLDAQGLGAAFLHSTGHGLGLEVHESPRLSRMASGPTDVLEAGMVCTIEPGAYVDGLGGARLEDDVLVTASGREVLTEAPLDLLVV